MVKATKVVICGLKGIGKTTYIEKLLYGENANPVIRNYLYTSEREI